MSEKSHKDVNIQIEQNTTHECTTKNERTQYKQISEGDKKSSIKKREDEEKVWCEESHPDNKKQE